MPLRTGCQQGCWHFLLCCCYCSIVSIQRGDDSDSRMFQAGTCRIHPGRGVASARDRCHCLVRSVRFRQDHAAALYRRLGVRRWHAQHERRSVAGRYLFSGYTSPSGGLRVPAGRLVPAPVGTRQSGIWLQAHSNRRTASATRPGRGVDGAESVDTAQRCDSAFRRRMPARRDCPCAAYQSEDTADG